MELTLDFRAAETAWYVLRGKDTAGIIFMDIFFQVEGVVTFENTPLHEERQILELACTHAITIIVCRPLTFIYTFPDVRTDPNPHFDVLGENTVSVEAMDFSKIRPDVAELSDEKLMSVFKDLRIPVVTSAKIRTIHDAFAGVIEEAELKTKVTFALMPELAKNGVELLSEVTFAVQDGVFEFWHGFPSLPTGFRSQFDNWVIPAEYLEAINRKVPILNINGTTAKFIHGYAIYNVYPPFAALALPERPRIWDHINHPFKAKGPTFTMQCTRTGLFSERGVQEIVTFLKAALGIEGMIQVSQGFHAPYKTAKNRLAELNRKGKKRDSAASCVWVYETLQEEDALRGAHIPWWFLGEKWLNIYHNAEKRHGIY